MYRTATVDEHAKERRLFGFFTAGAAAIVGFAALFRLLLEVGDGFFAWPPIYAVCEALRHVDPGPAWFTFADGLADVPPGIAAIMLVASGMAFTAFVQPVRVFVDERRRELVARTARWPLRARVIRLAVEHVFAVRVERVLPWLGRWIAIDDEGRRVVLGPLRFGSLRAAEEIDAHVERLRAP